MITYRLDDLQAATAAIQQATAKLAGKDNPEAAELIARARALVAKVPVDEATANRSEYNAIFKKKRKTADTKLEGRQAEIEQARDGEIKANYEQAKELAEQADSLL